MGPIPSPVLQRRSQWRRAALRACVALLLTSNLPARVAGVPPGAPKYPSPSSLPKFDSYSTFLSIEWKTLDHGRLTGHTRARTTEIQQRVAWGTRTINEIFWIVNPDGSHAGNSTQFGQCRDGFDTEWRWSVPNDADPSAAAPVCRCWRPKADRPVCTSYFENLPNTKQVGLCKPKPSLDAPPVSLQSPATATAASDGVLWRLFLRDTERFVRLDYCMARLRSGEVLPLWHEFAHGNEEVNTTQTVVFDRFRSGDPGGRRMTMPQTCIRAVCPAGQQGGWFGPTDTA